jgi:hypothetical protein
VAAGQLRSLQVVRRHDGYHRAMIGPLARQECIGRDSPYFIDKYIGSKPESALRLSRIDFTRRLPGPYDSQGRSTLP